MLRKLFGLDNKIFRFYPANSILLSQPNYSSDKKKLLNRLNELSLLKRLPTVELVVSDRKYYLLIRNIYGSFCGNIY